jgi:hypothetical protein
LWGCLKIVILNETELSEESRSRIQTGCFATLSKTEIIIQNTEFRTQNYYEWWEMYSATWSTNEIILEYCIRFGPIKPMEPDAEPILYEETIRL